MRQCVWPLRTSPRAHCSKTYLTKQTKNWDRANQTPFTIKMTTYSQLGHPLDYSATYTRRGSTPERPPLPRHSCYHPNHQRIGSRSHKLIFWISTKRAIASLKYFNAWLSSLRMNPTVLASRNISIAASTKSGCTFPGSHEELTLRAPARQQWYQILMMPCQK